MRYVTFAQNGATALTIAVLLTACGGGSLPPPSGTRPSGVSPPAYVPPPPPPPKPESIVLGLNAKPIVGKDDISNSYSFLYRFDTDCVVNGMTNQRCQIPASGKEYEGTIHGWLVLAGDALNFSYDYVSGDEILEGGVSVTWHGHDFVFPLTVPTAMLLECVALTECSFGPYDFVIDFGPGRLWTDPKTGTNYVVRVDNNSEAGYVPVLSITYTEYEDYASRKIRNRHLLFVDGHYWAE